MSGHILRPHCCHHRAHRPNARGVARVSVSASGSRRASVRSHTSRPACPPDGWGTWALWWRTASGTVGQSSGPCLPALPVLRTQLVATYPSSALLPSAAGPCPSCLLYRPHRRLRPALRRLRHDLWTRERTLVEPLHCHVGLLRAVSC
jgi:hypothetical protein